MIVFGYPTPDGPVFFKTIPQLLEMIGEGLDCDTAFHTVPPEGEEITLKITLQNMTEEEFEALPEY